MAIGARCAATVLLEPLLVPFAVVAAVALERPIGTEPPPAVAVPATS
ncbi:MAG: hypothetical protein ACJ779_09770 [Chloroflexota bacterium]